MSLYQTSFLSPRSGFDGHSRFDRAVHEFWVKKLVGYVYPESREDEHAV